MLLARLLRYFEVTLEECEKYGSGTTEPIQEEPRDPIADSRIERLEAAMAQAMEELGVHECERFDDSATSALKILSKTLDGPEEETVP